MRIIVIYSCTLFYNEFDLLRVKIQEELKGGVDKIIVVESERTFQNTSKPLYLRERAQEFPEIEIITVGQEFDAVKHADRTIACFQREAIQRNAGVLNQPIEDNDVIIYSDVDEIFTADDIPKIVAATQRLGFVHLLQLQFYYKINLLCNKSWYGPFAVLGGYLKAGLTLNRLRTQESIRIPTNGKHFSYAMTPDQIAQKIKSFSHVWFNQPEFTDTDVIARIVQEKKDLFGRGYLNLTPVQVDETYPEAMRTLAWSSYAVEATAKISEVPVESVPLKLSFLNEFNEARYEEINRLP
jgi:hypothetical protein